MSIEPSLFCFLPSCAADRFLGIFFARRCEEVPSPPVKQMRVPVSPALKKKPVMSASM
jgi:hypothetical protein